MVEHYPQTPQTPEALATLAYSYQKLGDKATSQQYVDILKLNYPNLVKSNGEVNLRAARKDSSWVNRATLGLLGRQSKNIDTKNIEANAEAETRSLTNRLSFGLLDKPETSAPVQSAAPASNAAAAVVGNNPGEEDAAN